MPGTEVIPRLKNIAKICSEQKIIKNILRNTMLNLCILAHAFCQRRRSVFDGTHRP